MLGDGEGTHLRMPHTRNFIMMTYGLGKGEDPSNWTEEKTRNETDIIRSRVKKTIEQDLADDPFAQVVFSELLKKAIAEAEAQFDHPHKQYILFKGFEEKVEARDVDGVPAALNGNKHAKAYFGTFRLILGDEELGKDSEEERTADALFIDETVKKAVAEHSLSPQDIESAIRKALLPHLFERVGLDSAKKVIEQVLKITRAGLSRGELL